MKNIYILAESGPMMPQKYIDFNLKAALKTGWLIELKDESKNDSTKRLK